MPNDGHISTIFDCKDIDFQVKYYGGGDWGGAHFLKNVIENIDFLISEIGIINSPITSIEGLYQFFWKRGCKQLVEELNIYKLTDQEKEKLRRFVSLLTDQKSDFVTFVNKNFASVLAKDGDKDIKWYEFFDLAFEAFYKEFSLSLTPAVFSFVETHFQTRILSSFDLCASYYKNHRKELVSVLDSFHYSAPVESGLMVSFLLENKDKVDNSLLLGHVKELCESFLPFFKEHSLETDDQNVIANEEYVNRYFRLAALYRLKCGNEYNKLKKTYEESVKSYVMKHGKKVQYGPIDLKPVIEEYKKGDSPFRFLQLTHGRDKNGNIICLLDKIFKETPSDPLTELFESRPRSDRYPIYKQYFMESMMTVSTRVVFELLRDQELRQQYGDFISAISQDVGHKSFFEEIDLQTECIGDFDLLINAIEARKDLTPADPMHLALTNACVVNTIATIEKILRYVFITEQFDVQYVSEQKTTIGTFLKDGAIGKSLSDGLKYYLEFYLSTEQLPDVTKPRPGKNWRNIQMHDLGNKYLTTGLDEALTVFFFLDCLLADLEIRTGKDEQQNR
jgi:hypothetical protein